jgi:hypothetical protein
MKSRKEIDTPAQPMATESQGSIGTGASVNPNRRRESRAEMKRRRARNDSVNSRFSIDFPCYGWGALSRDAR